MSNQHPAGDMRQNVTERFSFKISVILIIILFFSLTLNALLNFFNFEKTYRDLVSSRFHVAGKDLRGTIEYQLNLGLSLPEMKNVQSQADELKKKDVTIAAIEICDERGRILFATDGRRLGAPVTPRLAAEARRHDRPAGSKKNDERAVTIIEDGKAHILLPVFNSFGMRVGAITLTYPSSIIAGPVRTMKFFLLILFLITLLLFSAITFLTVHVISRHLRERITDMDSSLRDLLAGKPSPQVSHTPYGMELEFQTFRGTAAKALGEIADLEQLAEKSTVPGKGHGRKK